MLHQDPERGHQGHGGEAAAHYTVERTSRRLAHQVFRLGWQLPFLVQGEQVGRTGVYLAWEHASSAQDYEDA